MALLQLRQKNDKRAKPIPKPDPKAAPKPAPKGKHAQLFRMRRKVGKAFYSHPLGVQVPAEIHQWLPPKCVTGFELCSADWTRGRQGHRMGMASKDRPQQNH